MVRILGFTSELQDNIHDTCWWRGGGGVAFEGEQQAIMRTRPLPFRPSYSSLVSVLSLYGITGGTELHQTRPQHEPQSTRRVVGVKKDRREESVH